MQKLKIQVTSTCKMTLPFASVPGPSVAMGVLNLNARKEYEPYHWHSRKAGGL